MTIKKSTPDHLTISLPFPASTAVAVSDLLFWNSTAVAKASAQTDQGSETLNQRLFASLFAGVSQDQRLSSESSASNRVVITDGVFDATCPSSTWAVGDLVGASENSGGDALENQQVEKVTDPSLAIGYCIQYEASAVTTVRCRLISKIAPAALPPGALADGTSLVVGSSLPQTVSNGDGSTNLIPVVQVLGTTKADGSILVASFNATNDGTVAPSVNLLKSGNASIGGNTVVASGEVLGEINFFGADGTDFESPAASIAALVDTTPGTGDMPGRLVFYTTADAGETLTEALRITSSQDVRVNDGGGLIVGSTSAQVTISDGDGSTNLIPEVQVLGTTKADGSILVMVNSATATSAAAPSVNLVKSAHATIGSNTVVASGEVLGEVNFFGADGTDFESCAVSLRGIVNTTPGTGDMPGRLAVFVSADGAEAPLEKLRVTGAATTAVLTLGVAGTSTGSAVFSGATSGTVTLQPLAAAGTYTLTLPPDDGDAGEQLQTDGSGVMTWEAAGSLRVVKDVLAEVSDRAEAVLQRLLGTGVYEFRYKPAGRPTTGDYSTVYTGVMAEELPEVMHHGGRIFSPVSAFGELLLALKGLAAKVARLEASIGN